MKLKVGNIYKQEHKHYNHEHVIKITDYIFDIVEEVNYFQYTVLESKNNEYGDLTGEVDRFMENSVYSSTLIPYNCYNTPLFKALNGENDA